MDPNEEFERQDKKRKAMIIQCIANSRLEYVKDKKTAYGMLEAVFQRKAIASQLFLRKKLLSMKISQGDLLETHFVKFEETIRELNSVGAKLEETDIVCHL